MANQYTYNRMALAMSDAYGKADYAAAKQHTKIDIDEKEEELAQLLDDIREAQEKAAEERDDYSWWGSAIGCVVGGAIGGATGGPLGAVAGCSTGASITSTAVDWAYDGSLIQTGLEDELIELEEQLDELDQNLAKSSKRYDSLGAEEWEDTQDVIVATAQEQMDNWRESWYALSDADYFTSILTDIGMFAISEIGGDIIESAWASDANFLGNMWDDWMYSYSANIPIYEGPAIYYTDPAELDHLIHHFGLPK